MFSALVVGVHGFVLLSWVVGLLFLFLLPGAPLFDNLFDPLPGGFESVLEEVGFLLLAEAAHHHQELGDELCDFLGLPQQFLLELIGGPLVVHEGLGTHGSLGRGFCLFLFFAEVAFELVFLAEVDFVFEPDD